jgi:DNA-binding NtrC family response regulator
MFLRALEEREICRLGEVASRRVDFRLVAATNRDLKGAVTEGRFRADLYYRVAVVAIRIPPLRERTGEIPRLVAHFEAEVVRRYGLPERRLSPAAVRRLEAQHWPGNVRELRNVVESALLTAVGDVVEAADLPLDAAPARAAAGAGAAAGLTAMEALERDEIRRTLAARGGNVTATAKALGLAKSTVYAKLKRYGIDHGRTRRAG